MKAKFEKNDLIFYYQPFDFPSDLISKDVLIDKDIIFNSDSEEPELINSSNKKTKYAQCFIPDDEIEPKGKGGLKKGAASGNKMRNPKPKDGGWKKPDEQEKGSGFFDNFKGRTDERQVEKFKRNLEVSTSKEYNISIERNKWVDHLNAGNIAKMLQGEEGSNLIKEVETIPVDTFFENAEELFNCQPETQSQSPKSQSKSNRSAPIDSNPEILNIKAIFKINDSLGYPKDEPLWYIFHPVAKSSFGPLSSENIEEMYTSQMISGTTEIRLIDLYSVKNKKPFAYITLKDLENPLIVKEIEISPLVKTAVSLKYKTTKEKLDKTGPTPKVEKSQKEKTEKEKEKVVDKPEKAEKADKPERDKQQANQQSKTQAKSEQVIPPPKEKESKVTKKTPLQPIVVNPNAINPQDSIYAVPITSTEKKPLVDLISEENFPLPGKESKGDKKALKKMPKGKPVDLDIKLGFKVESDEVDKVNSRVSQKSKNQDKQEGKKIYKNYNNLEALTEKTSQPSTIQPEVIIEQVQTYDNRKTSGNFQQNNEESIYQNPYGYDNTHQGDYYQENYDYDYNYNNNYNYNHGNSYQGYRNNYWKK